MFFSGIRYGRSKFPDGMGLVMFFFLGFLSFFFIRFCRFRFFSGYFFNFFFFSFDFASSQSGLGFSGFF